jgi:hypothetical protein
VITLETLAKQVERQAKALEQLVAKLDRGSAPEAQAVKRSVAAKLMGIGGTKLDELIAAGKVRTAVDVKLVPMSEVKRYCAPKAPRGRASGRKPSLVIDETSAEAVAAMKRDLRRRRAGGAT